MRCEVHCPPDGGTVAGVAAVAALVFVFAAVASLAAAAVVASLAEAAALTVGAVILPASWVTWRLLKYGDRREVFRRHPVRPPRLRAPRQSALPAGSSLRALPAPQRVIRGTVLDDVYERTEA